MRWLLLMVLVVAGAMAFGACGGDDDDDPRDSDSSDRGSSRDDDDDDSRDSDSDDDDRDSDDDEDDPDQPKGVTAPLAEGSSATIEDAPDAGTVTMTIKRIISPANEILGFGFTVEPPDQIWAIEATAEANGGESEAIADYWIETDKGNRYGWTGTASGNDFGIAFRPGEPRSGYLAFQFPEDEEIVRLVASFSIYVGYDIIFEKE